VSVLKPFEASAIRILTKEVLAPELCEKIIAEAELMNLEHTGVGYYLTLRHNALPLFGGACDAPCVMGSSGGLDTGFIVFLGDRKLILECHTWGDVDELPVDYREREVELSDPYA